ncbi:hypothetical protein R1sor_013993 [Riccia sorocarpa]|uniref:Serine-threonine/tyrosine-protein kinase catalytic domain-containing protein n=1 Tax=Riccia sorocarpa TaxID=122646 RepID=A0ABD3HC01_9MARC
MATSSRGDKEKALMVEQEDIRTEEGELLDVHPPLPEPVGRSGSDRKRKKPAREEECLLTVALLPSTAEEKRVENARKKAEKDENYRQNSIFKHRCDVSTFGEIFGGSSEELDKHYDVWLKSREFESWTEDAVRQKGEKPLLIIPGLTMRDDEKKKRWKRTAEIWVQWFKPPNSIKDHACTSAEYLNVQPLPCICNRKHRLQIAGTMVTGLKFMHLHKWLHCDIHWQNVLLHFPSWDWDETKSRVDSGRDNENRPLSPIIKRSMVFVGFSDLGWAQSFEEVQKDFDPYPMGDENPSRWIAPELNQKLAIEDEDGKKYITKFSQESDIYALGWLIREMCGDFFTNMTDEEKHEYNRAVYTRGLHIPNATEVHGRVLSEGLEKMTWKKICHPFRNQRRTMDYWAHYFNEQLFIDPVTCARPIEYGHRAKVHPDGSQKVSRR